MMDPGRLSRFAGFKSLLSIQDCMLLLMDLDFISNEGHERNGFKGKANKELQLVTWAADHSVPILRLYPPEARKAVQRSTAAYGETIFCSQFNPLDDPKLRARLADLRRPRLLVAGGALETALAFSALSALELGYDVYLVRDLSWGSSEALADIVVARLLQAGVVPIIAPQLLCEWQRDERR